MARILIIDDDDALRAMLRKMLGDQHEVMEASSGDQGLALYEESGADLVISDIVMPDRDGIETIQELRERWPQVRILAMSGGGRIDAGERLTDAGLLGADATIRKPFRMDELRAQLAALLA